MEDFTLAEVIFHLSCLSDDDVEACKEICRWLCETIVLPKDLALHSKVLLSLLQRPV